MTFEDIVDTLQIHHPHLLENEIRVMLNRAQDDFTSRTDILKTSYTQATVANQRFYLLNPQILDIRQVEIDNIAIPRFVGTPPITDMDQ